MLYRDRDVGRKDEAQEGLARVCGVGQEEKCEAIVQQGSRGTPSGAFHDPLHPLLLQHVQGAATRG